MFAFSVQSSRFTTHYDGHCYLLSIPKVREYDQGTVTVHATNNLGASEATTELIVHPNEDFRLKLHHQEALTTTYEVRVRDTLPEEINSSAFTGEEEYIYANGYIDTLYLMYSIIICGCVLSLRMEC